MGKLKVGYCPVTNWARYVPHKRSFVTACRSELPLVGLELLRERIGNTWPGGGDIGNAANQFSWDNSWPGDHQHSETVAYDCNANDYTIFFRDPIFDPNGIFEPTANLAEPNLIWNFNTQNIGDEYMKTVNCPQGIGSPPAIATNGEIQDMLKRVLADTSTVNPYHGEMRWQGKLNVYASLLQNDSLLMGDTLLQAFHDSCHSANIGKLVCARGAAALPMKLGVANNLIPMTKADLNAFKDTLQGMSTAIVPEDALRDVLLIAFEHHLDTTEVADSTSFLFADLLGALFPDSTFTVSAQKDGFSSSQRSVLEAIAAECPYEYGPAVYMARAMLSQYGTMPYMGMNDCEHAPVPPSARLGHEEESVAESSEETDIRVYPNPTSADIHVGLTLKDSETAVFELFNIMGARVMAVRLMGGINTIATEGMGNGMYHFRVSVNNEVRLTGKEVIVR